MPKQTKFKVEKIGDRWWVMRRKVWDRFSRQSNHRTEELAYKNMHKLERAELKA